MSDARKKPRVSGRPRDPAADEAILQTAMELFLEQGVEAVCIDQITKRTGISRTTIYRRWSDREELLADALLKFKDPPKSSPKPDRGATHAGAMLLITELLVDSLMKPEAQRFTAHAIGAIPVFPKVVSVYKKHFIEPWRNALGEALIALRKSAAFPQAATEEMLLDVMSGAVMHRLLMRSKAPSLQQERAWVKSLLRELGLASKTGRS